VHRLLIVYILVRAPRSTRVRAEDMKCHAQQASTEVLMACPIGMYGITYGLWPREAYTSCLSLRVYVW